MVLSKIEVKPETSLMEIREMKSGRLTQLVKTLPDGTKDKSECYLFIKTLIITLNQYFGVTWSDFQITQTAEDFYSRFYYWHIGDYKKFMQKCKLLEYGKIYGQFVPVTLMEWAQFYDTEWMQVSEQISYNKHDQLVKQNEREREGQIRGETTTEIEYRKFINNYYKSNLNNKQQ